MRFTERAFEDFDKFRAEHKEVTLMLKNADCFMSGHIKGQRNRIDKAVELYEKELYQFQSMITILWPKSKDMIDIEKSVESFRHKLEQE